MSLIKSKCWYSNKCLHFSKCALPLKTRSGQLLGNHWRFPSYHRARVPQERADGWHGLAGGALAYHVAAAGHDPGEMFEDDLKKKEI
jgi:hypothetical protein